VRFKYMAKSFWQRRNANCIQFWRNVRRVCVSCRNFLGQQKDCSYLEMECHWEPL